MKMDADERELRDSVERGEWKSAKGGKRERARYSRYANATFRKVRRLNIRLSSKDLSPVAVDARRGVSAADRYRGHSRQVQADDADPTGERERTRQYWAERRAQTRTRKGS
jgi:hypothetical protein